MRVLVGEEEAAALDYLNEAAKIALNATCGRRKCGSIIVGDKGIIGAGFNSPPGGNEGQRRCSCPKDSYDRRVTDKTCCVHAEQRAIMDALRNNPDKILGSRLYFIGLDEQGNPARSGKPYCTICSKMALDSGIREFVLWHEEGISVYDTEEYNQISYLYKG